ncbi:hypothetical protein AB0E69_13975 [Kribbella sp. NPDC026611]|uniref:hypothetical protein n=1 Tax=Kribbella sp. NPDC026611 TaxID=3154911 RepID=UPI0033CA605F
MNAQPNPQTPEPTVFTGERRKISRAARRRVHAREHRVRRTQKQARAQLPTAW